MDIKELFEQRKDNPIWNTSYPVNPVDWARYRVDRPLSFAYDKELSFYIHIPFCKRLCSFCEYTRMVCPDKNMQEKYVQTIKKDVDAFVSNHPNITLRGFDIGGGTPTALSAKPLSFLLNTVAETISKIETTANFEPSIEATFDTIDESKTKAIVDASIYRMSLGIQSTNIEVLKQNHRYSQTLQQMQHTLEMLHGKGIEKINLDLMYGLKGQSFKTFQADLEAIRFLDPEQVTLYELRTNMIHDVAHMSKKELYQSYSFLYDGLVSMGYHARFGHNTFSKDTQDMGISSYLRSRMLDGVGYKGFGISAQSMSSKGISYNVGKTSHFLQSDIGRDRFSEEFTYVLPPKELAAKYIAIGGYSGSFCLNRLTQILGQDSRNVYAKQLAFCLNEDFLELTPIGRAFITPKGFEYYGAIFSLFYCPN